MTTQYLPSGLSEHRALGAARVLSVLVFSQDLELRYTRIHNATGEFPPDEIIGRTDEDLLGPDEARPLAAIKREVLSNGQGRRAEMRLVVRGEPRWYDVTLRPEHGADGRIIGVLGMAVDVTDLKRTEKILRQRTQRLALLFEAATGLLAACDPVRFLGQLFERLAVLLELHIYAHYAVSGDGTSLRLAASGGLTPAQRREMDRLELGQPPCGAVAATRHPLIIPDAQRSDEPVAAAIRALGLRAYVCHPLIAGGELFGTLAFGSKARLEHNDELAGLFRAVSDLLAMAIARRRAEQSLRDADRRKDEFLATLAHELRNPLAPLRSGIDLLQASREDAETAAVALAVMERQVAHLTRLVDDLLEVSRITQGRLELRRCRVELSAIIESALDQSRALFDQAGHELTIDLPKEPVVLDGDPVRLAQVLANLLSNAAKYTPERGHVSITAEMRDDVVTLSVRDDGIGIPADKLDHVFEMFEQLDRSFERSYQGLGLGLTLVKSLVEMHGGSVEARSGGPGRGSEFKIRLPAAASERLPEAALLAPDAPAAAASAPAVGTSGRRVLIVDDNLDAANLLGRLVMLLGHETCIVSGGAEALEAAARFRPDIVLLDIGMPGMSGYEVARRIREAAEGDRPVLVALTGWSQSKDKQRAVHAGFDHYLVKPVAHADLRRLLAEIGSRRRIDRGS